jgi:hypothetical protein
MPRRGFEVQFTSSPRFFPVSSAAVYTQTTDVEGKVNGLMTYDRKFIKVDPATLREMNAPLTGARRD